jgi:quercetin dioxygenase-like cupin family protein
MQFTKKEMKMTQQTTDFPAHSSDGTVARDSEQAIQQAGEGSASGTAAASPQSRVKYVPAGTGPAYWGPGSLMTFLITGEETNGTLFLSEVVVPPGGGPPPHIHNREDESFRLLEGTLTIQVGETTLTASPGDFVYLPRGIAHSFKNTGAVTAKALVSIAPAGLENYFAEVFDPVTDRSAAPPPVNKELIARAIAASPRYGLVLLPPA